MLGWGAVEIRRAEGQRVKLFAKKQFALALGLRGTDRGDQSHRDPGTLDGAAVHRMDIADPLQNPTLDLRSSDGVIIASNDHRMSSSNNEAIKVTQLAPTNPNESALLMTVSSRGYPAVCP